MKIEVLTQSTLRIEAETDFEKSFFKEWDVRSRLYGQNYLLVAEFPETTVEYMNVSLHVIKKGEEKIVDKLYDAVEVE